MGFNEGLMRADVLDYNKSKRLTISAPCLGDVIAQRRTTYKAVELYHRELSLIPLFGFSDDPDDQRPDRFVPFALDKFPESDV